METTNMTESEKAELRELIASGVADGIHRVIEGFLKGVAEGAALFAVGYCVIWAYDHPQRAAAWLSPFVHSDLFTYLVCGIAFASLVFACGQKWLARYRKRNAPASN
jgi:hypothetical protein